MKRRAEASVLGTRTFLSLSGYEAHARRSFYENSRMTPEAPKLGVETLLRRVCSFPQFTKI